MSTLTFDTHEFVKKLKGVGFSEEQAELITDLQKIIAASSIETAIEQARHDFELDNIATKRDLAEIKADLQRWIVTVVLGVGALQTAIITALVLKLVH